MKFPRLFNRPAVCSQCGVHFERLPANHPDARWADLCAVHRQPVMELARRKAAVLAWADAHWEDLERGPRSLRECVATGIYQRGLGKVAIDLDTAPSNLSVQLSEDPSRKFSVDSLETYLEKTGDTTPILYLVSKFLTPNDQPSVNAQALLSQMQALMKQAGMV